MRDARAFEGAADLAALLAFASAATRADFARPATWHPGDLAWRLATHIEGGPFAASADMRLWREGGDVVAMAWFYGRGDCRFDVVGDAVPLGDILAWADAHMGAAGGRLGDALEVDAFDTDTARGAALRAHGFAPAQTHTVLLRLDIARASPLSLPSGYRFDDCCSVDIDARVAAQRSGWDDLSQIGLPDARSSFTRPKYDAVASAPNYDPALDLVVRDASGAIVANATCWADAESGEGTFEPVSVVTAHRGKGLARALVGEGVRRFGARGLRRARIFTAHFNAPAIAAYQAAGFAVAARGVGWRRR